MNTEGFLADSSIENEQLPTGKEIEASSNISDAILDDEMPFEKVDTKEDYLNDSDESLAANLNSDDNEENLNCPNISSALNSQGYSQQVQIQLPSYLHSCFIEKTLSPSRTKLKKSYSSLGGFVILLCIVGIIAVGAVLVTRYLI